jgi:hypothetical protein
MFRIIAVSSLVLAVTVAADPPLPAPSPGELPTIGRTRSTRTPCVVLRDRVAPSLGAAMDANAAIGDAEAKFRGYDDGPSKSKVARRTLFLQSLNRNITAMAKDVRTISDALGDPRLNAGVQDPQLRALREALQALYDSANAKLNALTGYVETARMGDMLEMDEGLTRLLAATGASAPGAGIPRILATRAPFNDQMSTPQPTDAFGVPTIVPQAAAMKPIDDVAALDALAAKRIVAIANVCR